MFYNDYFLVDAEEVRERNRQLFKTLVNPSESCANRAHCRQCEKKCLQNLPISELLDAAHCPDWGNDF